MLRALLCICAVCAVTSLHAQSPQAVLQRYSAAARAQDAAFSGFSAERGKQLYFSRHVVPVIGEISCASCHLKDPRRAVLRHRTKIPCRACHVIDDTEHPDPEGAKKRTIDAFAPVANANRFTDFDLVQKWFNLNCKYVLKHDCTPSEKGDLMTWLLTFEPGDKDNTPELPKEYEWQ